MVKVFSYLMKKDAAAELGWSEEEGTAWPTWTWLLCLDGVMDTLEMVVSEDHSPGSAW